MAVNEYVNKVVYGSNTLIDLSGDDVQASDVRSGVRFHLPSGEPSTGTASSGGGAISIVDTLDAAGGTIRTITGITVAGTKTITENGTGIDVTEYAAVDVAVPSSEPSLQAKTNISPTESSQTITADSGYDGLSSVQINAVSSSYVGSGITRRSSTDLTASGATVTVPAGYYSAQASKAVASGTATAPETISGTSATVSTGTNTLTLTKSVSVTPSVTAGYISSGTAGNASVSLQASVTTQAAQTIHPSTSDQTISASRYLTGAQTIKAVTMTNLSAENIKSGVTVQIGDSTDSDCVTSVTGTYAGGSSKAIYMYTGLASRTANSYGATNAKVTVTKAGTYNIYYVGIRGSSSGTMGTNLHIGSTEKGNNTTWNNGTYGQYASYTNQSIAANTDVTIYATSGNASRTIYVGQLIVEEV